MKLPRPMVILLGAGASRAAFKDQTPPPPLDSDFFEIAGQIAGRGTGKLAKQVIKDVFDLYGKVVGIGLEEYYRDIETRLELSRFAKTQNKPKDWRKRKDDLEELVRRVLIHTTCEMDGVSARSRSSDLHRSIIGSLKDGDTIITFNYDTLIEESMPAKTTKCLWTLKDGYCVDVSGLTHDWAKRWLVDHDHKRSDSTKIELLKLHGSLNWQLYSTSAVRIKPRPYVVRTRRNRPVRDKAATLPPGWHKRVDRKPYSTLWQTARLRLDRCATLVIVGYSLPQTDLIARALFLEVNRSRRARGRYLKELHLADLDGTVKNKLVESFLPALGHTGQVFRYGDASELVTSWKAQGAIDSGA